MFSFDQDVLQLQSFINIEFFTENLKNIENANKSQLIIFACGQIEFATDFGRADMQLLQDYKNEFYNQTADAFRAFLIAFRKIFKNTLYYRNIYLFAMGSSTKIYDQLFDFFIEDFQLQPKNELKNAWKNLKFIFYSLEDFF